jgi:RNA polymerase sigma factor (TIGR02999 family)
VWGVAMSQITELLGRIQGDEAGARDLLFAAAYEELRQLAHSRLWDRGRGPLLDTTCLVHEAYLRCVRAGALRARDRRAFFSYASRVMRAVIVDSARERLAERRGGGLPQLTLSTERVGNLAEGEESILKVHEALEVLSQADVRLGQVVEMRYFGGYSDREIAEALDVTERTVERDWVKARLILLQALQ